LWITDNGEQGWTRTVSKAKRPTPNHNLYFVVQFPHMEKEYSASIKKISTLWEQKLWDGAHVLDGYRICTGTIIVAYFRGDAVSLPYRDVMSTSRFPSGSRLF
jgi:hypothetical protein